MTLTRTSIVAGSFAVLLSLTACSSSGSSKKTSSAPSGGASAAASSGGASAAASSGGAPAADAATTITIKGFAYSGALTVKPGQTVTVVNDDSAAHTLTDKATKKFDTGNIAGSGAKTTFTAPATAGSYAFVCTYHPNMAGTLVVKG